MHAWVDMTVVKGTMQREAATRDAEGRLLESGGLKLHRVCNPTTSSCHAPGTFREFKNQTFQDTSKRSEECLPDSAARGARWYSLLTSVRIHHEL